MSARGSPELTGLPDTQSEQRHVIVLRRIGLETINRVDDPGNERRRRMQVCRIAGDLDETILAPFSIAIIHRLGDAIGVCDKSVAGCEVDLGYRKDRIAKDADHRVSGREFNNLGSAHYEWSVMTGVDEAQPLRGG